MTQEQPGAQDAQDEVLPYPYPFWAHHPPGPSVHSPAQERSEPHHPSGIFMGLTSQATGLGTLPSQEAGCGAKSSNPLITPRPLWQPVLVLKPSQDSSHQASRQHTKDTDYSRGPQGFKSSQNQERRSNICFLFYHNITLSKRQDHEPPFPMSGHIYA